MMNLHKIWTISKFKIYQIVVNMQILPILLMGMIMPVAMNFILPRTDEFAQGNVRSIMIISMGFIFIAGMGSRISHCFPTANGCSLNVTQLPLNSFIRYEFF